MRPSEDQYPHVYKRCQQSFKISYFSNQHYYPVDRPFTTIEMFRTTEYGQQPSKTMIWRSDTGENLGRRYKPEHDRLQGDLMNIRDLSNKHYATKNRNNLPKLDDRDFHSPKPGKRVRDNSLADHMKPPLTDIPSLNPSLPSQCQPKQPRIPNCLSATNLDQTGKGGNRSLGPRLCACDRQYQTLVSIVAFVSRDDEP